ncbi:hypothetical protein D3C75_504800 [compost metagenome]
MFINVILKQQAEHPCRNKSDKNLAQLQAAFSLYLRHTVRYGCHFFTAEPLQAEQINKSFVENNDHGKNRSQLDYNLECVGCIFSQKLLRFQPHVIHNDHMAGGGNRSKFSQSFYDTENNGFDNGKQLHVSSSLFCGLAACFAGSLPSAEK